MMTITTRTVSRTLLLLLLAGPLSAPVAADPPAHAPAHGWRKKQDRDYVSYTGKRWETDYGVATGSCNREAVATVIGGVVGGAIASRVAEPENRAVATLIGAAAGAWVGNRIGRKLDDADEACFGHTLELAEPGQVVSWTNESTGVRYEMTPGAPKRNDGTACRQFTLAAFAGAERSSRRGLACQAQPGLWQIVQ